MHWLAAAATNCSAASGPSQPIAAPFVVSSAKTA
jgi:hypothetical protein